MSSIRMASIGSLNGTDGLGDGLYFFTGVLGAGEKFSKGGLSEGKRLPARGKRYKRASGRASTEKSNMFLKSPGNLAVDLLARPLAFFLEAFLFPAT